MKALVLGATGATGTVLVDKLAADETFVEVHVFVRRSIGTTCENIVVHLVDFDKPEMWRGLVNGDVAFSCMGTTKKVAGSKEEQRKVDVQYQFEFAKAAAQNGVEHFILLSAYGAHADSKFFYSRIKGELEEMVRELPFPKITFLQPGLLDRPQSDRIGERLVVLLLTFLNRWGLFKKYRPVPVANLANALRKTAKLSAPGIQVKRLKEIFDA